MEKRKVDEKDLEKIAGAGPKKEVTGGGPSPDDCNTPDHDEIDGDDSTHDLTQI